MRTAHASHLTESTDTVSRGLAGIGVGGVSGSSFLGFLFLFFCGFFLAGAGRSTGDLLRVRLVWDFSDPSFSKEALRAIPE